MKYILKIVLGAIVFSTLIFCLKLINHYDDVCFFTTAIITTIVIIINEEIGN